LYTLLHGTKVFQVLCPQQLKQETATAGAPPDKFVQSDPADELARAAIPISYTRLAAVVTKRSFCPSRRM
jgi:hypothetical protein